MSADKPTLRRSGQARERYASSCRDDGIVGLLDAVPLEIFGNGLVEQLLYRLALELGVGAELAGVDAIHARREHLLVPARFRTRRRLAALGVQRGRVGESEVRARGFAHGQAVCSVIASVVSRMSA